jgi:uncharacterized protein (TIGR03437 family)
VSIGPTAPTSGTDTGFISVTTPGASLSIAVVLNANSQGGTSPIVASPNSLSFAFAANSTLPATQQVAISSNSATTFTATSITNGTGNWLTVTPSSGNLPNTLQVTVTPSLLPPGTGPFNAALAINAPGTTGVSLPVLVTVGGTPAIKVSPAQMSFAFQLGFGAPAAQTLTVQSSTGANVNFSANAKTANCGSNWLVISQQTGVTPSTISVQINTSGLVAGTCSGEVDIAGSGVSNPSVVVPVSLLVSTNPLLLVPATGPTFNYQFGSNNLPAAQNVQITSSSTTLNFVAGATPVNGGPNFLTLSPVSGTTPQALAISVNPAVLASLGNGTYTETVAVSSNNAGNSPQSFPVTLVVNANALLTATVPSLNFNYQIGQTVPQSQIFSVSSTGAPLSFQISTATNTCSGFLSATANGGANGSTFGGQNVVVTSVNVTGITPQACTGSITLTVPGSTSPPLVIPVSLTVSNTTLMNVSPNAINVTALVGAAATTQTVSVTTTDNSQIPFAAVAATNPTGLFWLSVTPNGGNTASNLQVTINPANLGVGTYTGTINVSTSMNNVPAQSVPVTLVIVASNVSATPASLTFGQSLGGSLPASQSVQISGVPSGSTIGVVSTEFNGTNVNWLAASAGANNTVVVTADGSQLGLGTFSGVVTVIVPGAGNSPLYIPVTFTVTAQVSLAVSTNSVNFAYQAGATVFPQAQGVQVTSSPGSVPFTATFNAASGTAANLISVTPNSGNTPATISLAVNQSVLATLGPGTYSGTVVVSSTSVPGGNQTINVTVAVAAAAQPVVASILSGASFKIGAVAPGEIVSLFGNGMGPVIGVGFSLLNGKVPTTLANVTVTFNGFAAPLLYVSSTQINALVPYEVVGLTANVVVRFNNVSSGNFLAAVSDTAPGIFSQSQTGDGAGAILNQNLSVNGPGNPALKGSVIAIFGTGEGQVVSGGVTGSVTPAVPPFPMPNAKVSVTIAGQPAQVQYAGSAPTLIAGVLQVNAVVPSNIGSGPQTVVLTIGNNTNSAQIITVNVQ